MPQLSVLGLHAYATCPRRFYYEHVLRLPTVVDMQACRQRAVETMAAGVLSGARLPTSSSGSSRSSSSQATPGDLLHGLAPGVWKDTRVWYYGHLRRVPWFDVHERRRAVAQAAYAAAQTLAFAANRAHYPQLPSRREDLPPQSAWPMLHVPLSKPIVLHHPLPYASKLVDEAFAVVPRRSSSGPGARKGTLVGVAAGHHNDTFAHDEDTHMARAALQASVLASSAPELGVEEAVLLLTGPQTPQFLDLASGRAADLASAAESALPAVFAAVARMDRSGDLLDKERTAILGDPSDPNQEIDVLKKETATETVFGAVPSKTNCHTCKFRAFCKPHVERFRGAKLMDGAHKWLYGTAQTVVVDERKELVSVHLQPLDIEYRDFVVEHRGVLGRRLAEATPGCEVGLVDAELMGDDIHDRVFADATDPFSVLLDGRRPGVGKVEQQAQQVTAENRAYVERLGLRPGAAELEHMVYNLDGLRYVDLV
jgi:hypothetical protein